MPEAPPASDLLRFGVFELYRRAGEIRKNGAKVKLQEKPLRVLEILLECPGEVVPRDELRRQLWPADTFVDFDNSLNNAINKLRVALGDDADNPRFVETVGRRGYRFIAPVQPPRPDVPAPVDAAGPSARPSGEARARGILRWPSARHSAAAAIALAVAVPGLVWTIAKGREWAGRDGPVRVRSLAVLPFANLSGDKAQEYFADGMTDALITDLASIRTLRVVSRQSVMRYKASEKPMPEIARELGVDAVVEGSVARSNGRMRVTTQLVHGLSDRHLWARSYERDPGDALTLQAEMARSIAHEIQASLTPQEQARLEAVRPTAPAVYETYLKGRHFWHKRSGESLKKAVAYFQEPIEKDSGFALAHASLAECYGPLGYGGYIPPGEARLAMRAAASKALELDAGLVQARTALAACKAFHEWDWAGAEEEFKRAIELNPNYPTAHLWYGLYFEFVGQQEANIAMRKKALDLDPLSPNVIMTVAGNLVAEGRYDEAIARYREALELDPGFDRAHVGLAMAYAHEGLFEEAIAEARKAVELDQASVRTQESLGRIYILAGRESDGRNILEALEASSRGTRYVSPLVLATLYAALDEKEAAFRWLERAFGERVPPLPLAMRRDVAFRKLRPEKRFQDLLRRTGVPAARPLPS
jgi:TolB-like protein/DNA-binding winged helix-turn-helix (wHTH) protein/Tfp pilus assembly protein PilF